ncbi:hypothetical protein D3C85_1808760 [compost metagenome]
MRQYPVLVNMDWLYYEWRLAKAYLKEDCSLEYTDFEKKMWDLTRFMALYMVAWRRQIAAGTDAYLFVEEGQI